MYIMCEQIKMSSLIQTELMTGFWILEGLNRRNEFDYTRNFIKSLNTWISVFRREILVGRNFLHSST